MKKIREESQVKRSLSSETQLRSIAQRSIPSRANLNLTAMQQRFESGPIVIPAFCQKFKGNHPPIDNISKTP